MAKLLSLSIVQFEQRICDEPKLALMLIVSLSLVLFNPILAGKFAIGGSDVLFNHYPNLLFGYREFQEFGQFSLWNRYIFAGTDFTASMQAHYLNPLYWPLLLFPEKFIFHALTVGFTAMNAATGWVWFRISEQLDIKGYQSLLVAIVSQAGMFFWFSMTTMIAVPMYLLASFVCLLIITHNNRGKLANYVMMSVALGLLFVTSHPSYILGFFLPILVLFFVNAYPGWLYKPWQGLTPIFALACLTALLLSAYRLVPVGAELLGQGAGLSQMWLSQFVNHAYYGLTSFNPLALGISVYDSLEIGRLIGIGGHHTQAHSAIYFGIAPLVVIYVALRLGDNTKVKFLAFTVLTLQLTYLYALQPVSDIVNLIFFPVGVEGLYRSALAISFLFLLVESLKSFNCGNPKLIQKVIREIAFISGLAIGMWFIMYAKILHEIPTALSNIEFQALINFFRAGLLSLFFCIFLVCRLPLQVIARPRFGVVGVLFGLMAVIVAAILALATGLLSGSEIWLRPVKNALVVIFICIGVLASTGLRQSQTQRWTVLICVIAAIGCFLFTQLSPFGNGVLTSAWAGIVGWGTFIALIATTLSIIGLLANRTINYGRATMLLLALTLVDLVTAFDNYSYVNVNTSPFIRHLDEVYPTLTLPKRSAIFRNHLETPHNFPNLLSNTELHQHSGKLTGWAFGGEDMALCTSVNLIAMNQGNAVRVCYPKNDAAGNLYQDVSLVQITRQVAMGVWVRTAPGNEASLFLTSPSNNVGGRLVRHKGDGKWHWLSTTLKADKALQVVRPHINLSKAGYLEVYSPRLVSDFMSSPALRPSDGNEIVEPENEIPPNVDLDSYRLNHVHIINGYSPIELMTNLAIVARTPTYAGVDSDMAMDYFAFLKTFKESDPNWLHRAGLLSVIEDSRFLDLVGVAYDSSDSIRVVERPDAIPRFSAFSAFEVHNSLNTSLQRLKDLNFSPTHTVLLDFPPQSIVVSKSSANDRFQHLKYETFEPDHLRVAISAEVPRLIMFNDRFSPHWEAYWEGKPLQVIRANGIFMAVSIPPGAGELEFIFNPKLFWILAKLSAAVATLLLILSVAIAIYRLIYRNPVQTAPHSNRSRDNVKSFGG